MILVVKRDLLDELGSFQGLCFDVERYLDRLLDPAATHFFRRGDMEHDPSFKQIIPYSIITHGGNVLRYTRGHGGGEERLHALASIGIGGHINNGDMAANGAWGADSYRCAVERELAEEISLPEGFSDKIVALLNDDSNPVGQVHLGVVHLVRVPTASVTSREEDIAQLEWVTPETLVLSGDRLESWSALCAAQIEKILSLQ